MQALSAPGSRSSMPRNRRPVIDQTLPPVNDREQLTFESDTTNDSACFQPKLTYRQSCNPQRYIALALWNSHGGMLGSAFRETYSTVCVQGGSGSPRSEIQCGERRLCQRVVIWKLDSALHGALSLRCSAMRSAEAAQR